MKKYLLGITVGLISVLLVSCDLDGDGYSLTDIWVSFGILYENDDSNLGYTVKLDDGDVLYPIASSIYMNAFDDSCRVLVNYTVLGDKADSIDYKEYYVKINAMRDILMKGILDITPEIEDSIGNDPIIVKDAWISNNLLNFELKYWGNTEIHYINLVKQPGVLAEASQPIELELRHNDNGDLESIPYAAYVSFDLSALKIESADSVKFRVTATDYDGYIYSDEGVYKYGSN